MSQSPTSSNRPRTFRRTVVVFACLAAALVISLLVYPGKRAALPPVVEIPRKDLVLREGLLCRADGTVPFAGIVTDAYDGGELKSRSVVSNGLLQGLSQGWWPDGTLQVSEFFSNGISHGVRTKYYPNGSKQSVANIVQGKIEGIYDRWHENGTLAEQVRLTQGVADGESLAYHSDGSLKARVRLDHGKVIEQKFWAPGEAPSGFETPN